MIYSFAHLHDLNKENINLYQFDGHQEHASIAIKLDDLSSHVSNDSTCVIFLSSKYFSYKPFVNELNLKHELLQATVLNEVEESIISNISELCFMYDAHLELGVWIHKSHIDSLNEKLNLLQGNIIVLPEHFLLGKNQNRLLFDDSYFCFGFEDNSGFSGSIDSLNSFLDIIDGEIAIDDVEIFSKSKIKEVPLSIKNKSTTKNLSLLYKNFIDNFDAIKINFFKRTFSFMFIKSQFNLNKLDASIFFAALFIILLAPLISSSFLKSYSNSYKAQTIQVFQQLNPNFNRLVNPRAQIDDLTRNAPEQTILIPQNLDALNYVYKLSDESIKKVEIDIINQSIILQIEKLSPPKLKVLTKLLSQYSSSIDTSKLLKTDDLYNGSVKIYYAGS